jgi:cell wall-associated NlpC family hydrolase
MILKRANNTSNVNLAILVSLLGLFTSYLYLVPGEYYFKPAKLFTSSSSAASINMQFPAERLAMKVGNYVTNMGDENGSQKHEGSARLVNYLKSSVAHLHQTRYVFGGSQFDAKKGVYKIDCSGLVNRLVQTTCPKAYQEITGARHTPRPTTLDYYSFLGSIPHGATHANWQSIDKVKQLKPGDILVYRFPGKPQSAPGHMMVVVEAPKPVANKAGVYYVRVADSANSGHTNDTRKKHTSGVGIGSLMLKTYAYNDRPCRMSWKEGSKWGPQVNFAMGRAVG